MKKHIFAISAYVVTFCLSVLLVGLLTGSSKPVVSAPLFDNKATFIPKFETTEQSSIRTLLTLDQQYGFEYFDGVENACRAENLVIKMRSLENQNMPLPVRKAYKVHIEAWNNYARHLKNAPDHDSGDRDCRVLNREISETYNTVLLSAKSYGVDFSN
ncbi:MAG: hypothetical protein ABIP06_12880 [Pyrinomonadaceae bacterium]